MTENRKELAISQGYIFVSNKVSQFNRRDMDLLCRLQELIRLKLIVSMKMKITLMVKAVFSFIF